MQSLKSNSCASLRKSSEDISRIIEQCGSSDLSLDAEKAVASLGETEAREDAGAIVQSPGRQSSKRRSLASLLDSDIVLPQSGQSQCSISQVPSTSSTVEPASSSTYSGDGHTEESDSNSNDSAVQANRTQRIMAAERLSTLPLPPWQSRRSLRRSQHQNTPNLPGQAGRPPGSPMTYQDLGTDYTRYYNPFLQIRGSSLSDRQNSSPRSGAYSAGPTTPRTKSHPINPFLTPQASTSKVNVLYNPEKNASVVDDRLIAPYEEKGLAAWPLIGDKAENDDEMHMPRPDDDTTYKPKWRDHFTRDSIASTIGLLIMISGLLFIFVALPIMSFTGIITYNSAYSVPLGWLRHLDQTETWSFVNHNAYPILQNVRIGLIDPDTPRSVMKKIGELGDEYGLVFSDEFNKNNRTFYEGDDPYFFAGNFWYGATQDLEWYDPDAVTTYEGTLELRLDHFANHGLSYRSGMLNSWNQLCFKGGIFEVSVSLPGPGGSPGLWPGAWTMGNLGRPGYLSTTDGLWPYTYQACDAGITPNQSSYDGLSNLPGQRLPSCSCDGEDHPTPGKGRGAPEIDVIEAGASYPPHNLPIATQSLQVAPFDVWWYPNYNFTAFPDYTLSFFNTWTGGPYQQAISATTNLNKDWYDGKQYQRYSFEYVPGEGKDAYISWKIGDQTMFMLDGRAIGPNGNIQARQVPEEPMSLILNLGISNAWTFIDWSSMKFPATMRIDYVRWYQKKGETMVTCDPPGFETTQYIKDHINAYTNPNFTVSSTAVAKDPNANAV
jgi:beta-glucanase (GH16 family)